jgi:hypothetical protein
VVIDHEHVEAALEQVAHDVDVRHHVDEDDERISIGWLWPKVFMGEQVAHVAGLHPVLRAAKRDVLQRVALRDGQGRGPAVPIVVVEGEDDIALGGKLAKLVHVEVSI